MLQEHTGFAMDMFMYDTELLASESQARRCRNTQVFENIELHLGWEGDESKRFNGRRASGYR